jgi:hypothetical protein
VLLGVARRRGWDETVTVLLHHVPDSEEFEGGYEAETMKDVPNDVRISCDDPDSMEEALDHFIGGLALLGFEGRVVVEDAAELGPKQRYEVEAPPQA